MELVELEAEGLQAIAHKWLHRQRAGELQAEGRKG